MKYPIRVLQLVTYMGRGGLETMLMNYYRHMDHTKVQFDFLTHRDFEADYDKEIVAVGGQIYHLSKLNPISLSYKKELDEFFNTHKEYKVVHSHLDCMSGIPLKEAKKCHVPYRIAHAHSSNQTKDMKYPLKLIFKRNITKDANYLFACGDQAGKWMFNTDNFKVLNNAIDAKAYSFNFIARDSIREEFHIPNDSFVIGHVGRFMNPKNHTFIIDIFNQFHKDHPNSYLMLVGEGELKTSIQDKVRTLGLEDYVIFAGLRSDVNEVLQAMDVFLFPSLYEGLPVSIIEAQAAGLPIVASTGVTRETDITGNVTFLSLDRPAEVWARRILDICSDFERVDMTEAVRNAGYDIKQTAQWLQNFYLSKAL